ncbi:MAG: FHA domain-containing protein [Pseudomonadota bacterium]
MTEQLVLEVIDGPMDGLNCLIDKQGNIGRNVGNILSLALDLEISGRHAEILREGPSWCLRDLQSTNGTWIKGKKIDPGKTFPLKMGDTFIAGSTIIQLFQGSILDVLNSFSDKGFSDPRKEYVFSPEFDPVWQELYDHMPPEGNYCDIRKMFLALVKAVDEKEGEEFSSVRTLSSGARYKILDPCLANIGLQPMLQTMPQTLVIAPRVWRVLDLAAKKDKEGITPLHFCKAVLEEGRSLVSRYIRSDQPLLERFGVFFGRPQPGKAAGISQAPDVSRPLPTGPEASAPRPEENYDERIWLDFVLKIERIIKGFLDDAESPIAGAGKQQLPELEGNLQEALRVALDKTGREKIISARLETLSHLLVLILAAQREGYMDFATRLGARISKALAATDDQSKGLLPLGKKALTAQDITNTIRATLTKVESEGMGEQVIREQIQTKLRKYREKSQSN